MYTVGLRKTNEIQEEEGTSNKFCLTLDSVDIAALAVPMSLQCDLTTMALDTAAAPGPGSGLSAFGQEGRYGRTQAGDRSGTPNRHLSS